ncbi:MAG: right-handed parallel beta-helix repeat-containing protein [Thermoplasmatales archaeon]|nr:right-handed parallel beta-helix repeat-containing protein [Thermoplasmatales archaeon]
MNIKKALAVIVIVLFISVSVIPSSGTNIIEKSSTMSFDGNTLYVGGSGPGNYTKIQDAINDSSDGDMVFVFNGTYVENLVVDKSIDLIGEDKNSTVIDGNGVDDVVYVSADEVNVTGFTVQNSGYVACAVFDLNGTLVDIFYDSGLEIRSNSNSVFGNIIAGYIFIKKSSDNSIFCNKIFSMVLFNSSNNVISNNNVSDNFIGISLYYSISNRIIENNIYSNDKYGLSLNYSSNNNKIYHNNFIENVQNAYDECNNSWDKGYPSCGNYWDDYGGVDNFSGSNQNFPGQDGVGDTPYDLPCEYATDRYPLMEPYGMTKLTFSIGPGLGLFKFSGIIKNIGNKTAFNVQWKITIDGGFIIVGRHSSGTVQRPLLPGEETSISSKLVLGFGRIMITVAVWADNAPLISESIPGTLFLIFLML